MTMKFTSFKLYLAILGIVLLLLKIYWFKVSGRMAIRNDLN